MKKILFSIFAIAALAACTKEDASVAETSAFKIIVNPGNTKPVFNQDDYSVSWKADEQLHVLINGDAYTFSKTQDSDYSFECAEFQPVAGQEYNWEIVTPYRSEWGEKTFSFSGGVGPVMYGTGTTTGDETPGIHMNLLNSIVRLEIENTGETDITITQYRFESDTDFFGGRRTIVDGEVVLKEGVDPVKYTALTSGNDITVKAGETGYKCLQCGPFVATVGSKLKVTLTAGADVYTKDIDVTGPLEFKAGKVKTTHINIAKEAPQPTGDKKVYVDFGNYATTSTKWNSVTSKAVTTSPIELKDGDGNSTDLTLAVTTAFADTWGGNGSEPVDPFTADGIDFPKDVYKDALKVTSTDNPSVIEIGGCETGATYTIKALAFRYGGSRTYRLSLISVNAGEYTEVDTGARSKDDMTGNNFIATYTNVTPSADGKISISVKTKVGANGTTKEGFINALVIEKE